MKQHTVLGYDLLANSDVDPRIALVALQHHEREDGSGYPHGIKGDQIDRLSKIVGLADIYMAMTSERPHRPAYSFFEVINEIHEGIIRFWIHFSRIRSVARSDYRTGERAEFC
ncbi:Cyclic di-GMP phosphodiesterase response regulator RpfG [compost metagenome]